LTSVRQYRKTSKATNHTSAVSSTVWAVMVVPRRNIAGMLWHRRPAERRTDGGSGRRRTSWMRNVVQKKVAHNKTVAAMVGASILTDENMLSNSFVGISKMVNWFCCSDSLG